MDKNLEIVRTALYHKKTKTLILGDLHLGYEEHLSRKGIFVPKFQFNDIIDLLEEMLKKKKVENVVFNGDIKHEFGTITETEWRYIIKLFDFFIKRDIRIIIVQGNHDPIIKPIAEKRGISIFKEYVIGDILIIHGDFIPKDIEKNAGKNNISKKCIKTIIIGHEHPAISLKENERIERFKCFLIGKWKGIDLIIMPSVNPLVEGTDILQEKMLSPFLKDVKLDEFDVYICGEKTLYFGKISDVKGL